MSDSIEQIQTSEQVEKQEPKEEVQIRKVEPRSTDRAKKLLHRIKTLREQQFAKIKVQKVVLSDEEVEPSKDKVEQQTNQTHTVGQIASQIEQEKQTNRSHIRNFNQLKHRVNGISKNLSFHAARHLAIMSRFGKN